MSMEAAATATGDLEPVRATSIRPAGDSRPRAARWPAWPIGLDGEFCRAVELVLPAGERDRLRHGQGGAGGAEDHGHAGLDRHAEPLPAPGRGGPRRPGPRAPRRRDADALAKRRDGGNRPPAALAGRVRRADRGDHRPARPAAWAGRPRSRSSLARLEEACSLGLAPSTSTTAMLAVGDALALVVSQMRHFSREDFARFHPGRQPGLQAEQSGTPCPAAGAMPRGRAKQQTVREVLVGASMPGRRTGATMLVDAAGQLSGIFTDSDLARLFEHRRDGELDGPIGHVMTRNPLRVEARLDDGRRRGDHGRAEDQRIAGGRCRRQTGRPDRHHRRGRLVAERSLPDRRMRRRGRNRRAWRVVGEPDEGRSA